MAESQVTSLRGNYTPLAIGWSVGMICTGFILSALFDRLGKSESSIDSSSLSKKGSIERSAIIRTSPNDLSVKNRSGADLRALKRVQKMNV